MRLTMSRLAGAFLPLVIAVALSGCSDSPSSPAETGGHITLHLDHREDSLSVVADTVEYTNAAGNTYSIEMLRYYLSDVSLHRSDGGVHYAGGVHFRDFKDESTRAWDLGTVPDGTYDSLTFTFGLDDTTNVTGGLPLTQESLDMAWPVFWGGGYHYMQLQGRFAETPDSLVAYAVHLGAMTVDPDPVRHHFFFTVTLPIAPITIAGDDWDINLLMNVNQWFTAPNTIDLHDCVDSIMQNLAIQQSFKENGADAFSIGTVARRIP